MSGDLTFNKYAAAILATALGFMLIKEVSHKSMHVSIPDIPAYGADLVVDTGPTDEVPVDLPFPQPEFIAAMDAEKGAKVFKKCTSCHTADEGGKNGTGPNLWNILGEKAGQNASFTGYSGAMTTSGIIWEYEELNDYLTKPKEYVPGTKMNFVGLKKEADRAAVIEYLRVASNAPQGKPVPAAAPQQDASQEAELNEVIAKDDAMGEKLGDAAEGISDIVEKENTVAEAVVDKAGDVVDGAVDTAGDVVDAATDAASDAADTATDAANDLLDKAQDAVEDKAKDVVEGSDEH